MNEWFCQIASIVKRMNAFKLMMNNRHFYEWIYIHYLVIIYHLFQVHHQFYNGCIILWRRVNNLACFIVHQFCAGQ